MSAPSDSIFGYLRLLSNIVSTAMTAPMKAEVNVFGVKKESFDRVLARAPNKVQYLPVGTLGNGLWLLLCDSPGGGVYLLLG